MHSYDTQWQGACGLRAVRRTIAAIAVAGLSLGAPMMAHAAAPQYVSALPNALTGDDPRAAAPERIVVTPQDVAASNAKVKMAYDALLSMWGEDFQKIGTRFDAPGLVRYRGGARTSCGVMGPDNAAYCPEDNVIYFDEVFVAGQAKSAAAQVGTDGDMAAVGIIAHEMGHAVALQLGHESRFTYENEATADCLAGAFTHRADKQGELEQGDKEEAFAAMYAAGDPEPQLTGNARVDRRIMINASLMGHGTYDKRMANFRTGLDGGAQACLAEFRGVE